MLRLAAATLLILAATAARAEAARWQWPVEGELLTGFAVGSDRFAAGQHRGIDIGAPFGATVRAACAGKVAFAGTVGSSGRVVSVVCGRLTATYVHLGAIAVRRHVALRVGQPIGTVGASAHPRLRGPQLHFGLRLTARRHAYVDPLSVLPNEAGRAPIPVALPLRPRFATPLGPAPPGAPGRERRVPIRRAWRAPSAGPAPGVPWQAWLGIGLVAAGLPGLGLRRARRRRRSSLRARLDRA